jgi:hypothetical protein
LVKSGETKVVEEDIDLNYVLYHKRTETNSNVVLSAWGSFIMSLLLVTSWWKATATVRDWLLLAAFSISMMISSYFAYNTEILVQQKDGSYTATRTCSLLKNYSCDRILIGQYLGLGIGVISLIMITMTRVSVMVHVIVSAFVFIGWAVGVSLIAYGSGHGTTAGEVFMEVWACVFLSLDVLITNIAIFVRTREHGNESTCPVDNQPEPPTTNLVPLANQEQSVEHQEIESKDPVDTLDLMPNITEAPEAVDI